MLKLVIMENVAAYALAEYEVLQILKINTWWCVAGVEGEHVVYGVLQVLKVSMWCMYPSAFLP